MRLEASQGHLLVFRTRLPVVGIGPYADAAARREDARHLDVFRLHQCDEVFHDDVDTVFVEIAVIAETEEIEFQALALHHASAGNVAAAYFGKGGLSRDGAEARELGAVEAHPVVVVGMFVFKRFEHLRRIVLPVFCFSSQYVETFVRSVHDEFMVLQEMVCKRRKFDIYE